jgi:hypothetical protein
MENGFKIISTCNITQNKQLVISKNKNDEIVVAKRFTVFDEGFEKFIYEKGATILNIDEFKKLIDNVKEYFLYEEK